MPGTKARTASTSFLTRPRLMRSQYSPKLFSNSNDKYLSEKLKKNKPKKITPVNRYDILKKGPVPDYTDVTYKEAVSRLRYMLNETYGPPFGRQLLHGEESDEELSVVTRLGQLRKPEIVTPSQHLPTSSPHELLSFIERQEDYIEQLEKESQYCRDELSQLLGKVKDLISENETLHNIQKTGALKKALEGFDESSSEVSACEIKSRTHLEGPAIFFESRIAELEAQLTQSKRDLKKSQEEVQLCQKKLTDNDPSSSNSDFYRQIEILHREKRELTDTLSKVQNQLAQLREKESDTSKKVQKTLTVADRAQLDRQQAEMEVQRLKTELEQQHDRLLEVLSEQTRKVAEERSQAERRYLQHVESLSNELAIHRDSATKLQLDLERHIRVEEDLRRDLTGKNATLETVRKDFNSKIANLQSELSEALSDRDFIQQELNACRMSNERSERSSKQDVSRLQVEVNALRQRIERSDSELMHARRENLRLAEQLSAQEKEISLFKIRMGDMDRTSPELDAKKDSPVKEVDTAKELEALVEKQSQAMQYLTQQCHSLTQKLEEATARHKEEMGNLQSNLEYLSSRVESSIMSRPWQYNSEYHEGDPTVLQQPSVPNIESNQAIPEEISTKTNPAPEDYAYYYQEDYNGEKQPVNTSQLLEEQNFTQPQDDYNPQVQGVSDYTYQNDEPVYLQEKQPAYDYQPQESSYQEPDRVAYQQESMQQPRENPSYKQENSTYEQENGSLKQENPPFTTENTSYKQENPTYKQENPSNKQENPTFKQENPSYKQENLSYKQENPTFKQENPSYKQENPTYKQENPTFKQENPSYKQENPTYKQEIPPEKLSNKQEESTYSSKPETQEETIRSNVRKEGSVGGNRNQPTPTRPRQTKLK